MSQELADSSVREQKLNRIIAEYLEAVDAGRRPSRRDFLDAHPDFAKDLAVFLDEQGQMDLLAQRFQLEEEPRGPDRARTVNLPTEPTPTRVWPSDVRRAAHVGLGPFGDYELLDEVARGGMGVVYRARQVSLNRIVALKMILTGTTTSAEDLARFRIEAEAAAHLDHPNIVPIHDVGVHDGRHFFSMKFIEGGSLAEHIGYFQDKPVDTARMLAQVARAVQFAHDNGILHRDLKPGNILITGLTKSGPARSAMPWPMITDFGLAKRLEDDSTLTQAGAVVGTPSYMAPEQASGEGQVDRAADIFSLGAILYHVLTGRKPFQGETPLATLVQVQTRDPVRPSAIRLQVPRDLETVCLKCLDKDPRRRYRSAGELADDLERFSRGDPIQARRVSLVERMIRGIRRRPLVSAMSALLIIATVTGLALWHNLATVKSEHKLSELQHYVEGLGNAQAIIREKPKQADFILGSLPARLRGWEWSLLRAEARQNARILRASPRETSLCNGFSEQGDRLAVVTPERTIDLLSIPDETRIASLAIDESTPTATDSDIATALRFSRDGKWLGLVSVCRPRKGAPPTSHLVLWRLDHSEPWLRMEFSKEVVDLAFDPSGKFLALAGRQIRILNLETKTVRDLLKRDGDSAYVRIAWSNDGRRLAACGNTRLSVWTVPDFRRSDVALATNHTRRNLTFLPNGDLILCDAATICIVKPAQKPQELARFKESIIAVQAMPDSSFVILGCNGETARVDAKGTITALHGGPNRQYVLDRGYFSADGKWVASYCAFGPSHLYWEVFSRPVFRQIPTNVADVAAATLKRRDGILLAAGSGTVWSVGEDKTPTEYFKEDMKPTTLAMRADGSRIAVGGDDGKVVVRRSGSETQRCIEQLHKGAVRCLDFSANVLASGGVDGVVALWPDEGEAHSWKAHEGGVAAAAFSGDRTLVTAGRDGAKIWDLRGNLKFAVKHEEGSAQCLAVDPKSRCAAFADDRGRIILFHLDTGSIERQWGARSAITALAFSDDGRVISGAANGTLTIWSRSFANELLELTSPNEPLQTLFMQGAKLYAVYRSGLICIWDAQAATE